MATVDDKVVAMSFESSKFESGVNKTIAALDKLKHALSFPSAGKGLEAINSEAEKVNLSHIGNAVDGIKHKFSALSIVGITALANIVSRAVSSGISLVKAFTIDPIKAGFKNYETQINAVQTILANTGLKGKAGLDKVNAALKDLNTYANLTVYNFSEMAKNIGTFTAAGVDLKTSTASIKGIANLAALSGSNSQQASTAMYQLSQAIAANQVKLQDWNSVVNAGMGGKVFQKALFTTAEALHTIKGVKVGETFDQWTKAGNTFRGSLKEGWINAKVLTQTLSNFTGDVSVDQLKAQGYTAAQIKLIREQAKTAVDAATNIKTFTQLTEALKEEVATAYAAIFKTIFGNLGTATKLFSAIHVVAENALTKPIYDLNRLLEGWVKLGGRKDLLDGLKTAFKDLSEIVKPLKEAFRDIFPAQTGQNLVDLTKKFDDFTKALKPSPATIEDLRRTFRGLFAILDIGKQILGGIFTVFGQVFGAVSKGGGSFLDLTGNLGDFLVKVDEALKKGGRLHDFFVGLGNILAVPIHFIELLAGAIAGLFKGVDPKVSGAFSNSVEGIGKALTPFKKLLDDAKKAWDNFTGGFSNAGVDLQKGMNAVIQLFANLGSSIAGAIQHTNLTGLGVALQTGLIGGIFVILRKFIKGGFSVDIGGGLFKSITESFEGLTGTLSAMQQKLKADMLEKIAISIGILAASIVALSVIDPKRLDSAMSGLTIAFGELLGAMAILNKITLTGGFLKMPIITASMGALAFAVGVLTLSVLALSKLDLASLAKGLGGVGALLGGLVLAAGPLSKSSAGLISAGAGITAIAVGMRIMASAVKAFGSMDLLTLAKGIGAVALSLGAIGLASRAFPSGMVRIGLGLVEIAFGLKGIVGVVSEFGHMDLLVIGKGLLGVGGSIAAIGASMRAMPPGMALQAAGLILVAHAIQGIAKAVTTFGGMSLQVLAKGIGALALSLGVLAAALLAMEGGLGGAIALTVAAAGLRLLAPAMKSLGQESWGQIAKGMIALAISMGVLGGAALLMEPVAPALLALSVAMLAIGGGFFLVGAGIALLGTGLAAIAVAGPAAIGILIKALIDLMQNAPKIVESFISALVQIVSEIAKAAPKIVAQLGLLLVALAKAVIAATPEIAKAFGSLIDAGVKIITQNLPKLIKAGAQILSAILNGIANNIGLVLNGVTNIILHILTGIDQNINKLVQAGAKLIAGIATGIANGYNILNNAATKIVVDFANTIGKNLSKIVRAGANMITTIITALGGAVDRIVAKGADVVANFVVGLGKDVQKIIDAGATAIEHFVTGLGKNVADITIAAGNAVLNFLTAVDNWTRKHGPEITQRGIDIAVAIVEGIAQGIRDEAGKVIPAAVGFLVDLIPGPIRHLLHIKSPSLVMHEIGQNIVQGLANGMTDSASLVTKATSTLALAAKEPFKETASFYSIGKFVGTSFAQGLVGSTDQINQAFTNLNSKLAQEAYSARSTIDSNQQTLKQLLAAQKPDTAAIQKAQDAIIQNEMLLSRVLDTQNELNKGLTTQKTKLKGLAADFATIDAQLKTAQQDLTTAQNTRDNAISQFTSQFDTLPTIVATDANGNPISPADQLAQYEADLQSQASAVGTFGQTLAQLRKLGLNDSEYQKLVTDGTADQDFANQLLAGGKTAVDGLNTLDAQLAANSAKLGKSAGTYLYQAGVDSAQGIVDGLASQETAITKEMEQIAQKMVTALKKKLKIKSPSEVFAEIGKFSSQGMAQGLNDSAYLVANAAENMASSAVDAMASSMGDISLALANEIDTQPTIKPVLDLTDVQAGAKQMSDILSAPINASTSNGQAIAISATAASPGGATTDTTPGTPTISFEQNNYSPESLSPIDIYRQTRNQLSQARSMLANAN